MFQKTSFFGLLLVLLAASGIVVADEVDASPNYDLFVEGDRVSLRVVDGSLVDVVEKLGGLFGFEVIANLREDVRVDVDFDDLELSAAIREICAHIGYVEAPDPETGQIARLVLVSGGSRSANRAEARREPLAPRRNASSSRPGRANTPDAEAIAKARAGQARTADDRTRQQEAARGRATSRKTLTPTGRDATRPSQPTTSRGDRR